MAELNALAGVLVATLSPDAPTRRQAERDLLQAQAHPSFGPLVLQLCQDPAQNKPVRQSAALSFKNWIKANWAVSFPFLPRSLSPPSEPRPGQSHDARAARLEQAKLTQETSARSSRTRQPL